MKLKKHNKKSYENTMKLFKKFNRVCVEQATSTGKSYVIAKLIADSDFKRVLLLAPSTYILNQFKEKFPNLDKTVDVLDYVTYQKTLYFKGDEIVDGDYDLIILDEYHRLGAKKWGDSVTKVLETCSSAKIFGTSATPIRSLDNGRDMSEEIFGGVVANKITLEDALSNNILAKPKYIIGMYDIEEDKRKLRAKLKARGIKDTKEITENIRYLTNNFNKTNGVANILKKYIFDERKFIIFCESITHLKGVKKSAIDWFTNAFGEEPFIYEVYTGKNDSEEQFEEFKNGDKSKFRLLLVVNVLNEGVHVDGIDGVIMLRSTASINIFYQQIGRALVLNSEKPPLIFDFVKNSCLVANAGVGFDPIKNYQKSDTERKEYENKDYSLEFNLEIFDETVEIINMIHEIDESLSYFEIGFRGLVTFKEEHGHLNIPKSNKKLYKFKGRQIHLYNLNKLSQNRIDMLNSIGIVWDIFEELWNTRYMELAEFKEEHGHLNVPDNEEYKTLSTWVKTQKRNNNAGKLTPERKKLLSDLGMNLETTRLEQEEMMWQSKFKLLKEFKEKHGYCNISSRNKENKILVNWIQHQRRYYRLGKLLPHREKLLRELGLEFYDKQKK